MKNVLNKDEVYYFKEGTWTEGYKKLGAHPYTFRGRDGYLFALWAPNAKAVSVVGDFNGWNPEANPLTKEEESGIWQEFLPGLTKGMLYKYVVTGQDGSQTYKADPYAFFAQRPPETASVLYDLDNYKWKDAKWMSNRAAKHHSTQPLNIYELHLGSWRRHSNADQDYCTYEDFAEELVNYISDMGYTHIEILPVMEHPFDGSWGYQTTGYFAPTSRYGKPEEFKHLIDACHRKNIGVILDWAAGHFCKDAHGLYHFDGGLLYEKGEHPQWGTCKFDFGRGEVESFLLSNANYWFEEFHADGIRVDGVTSMLYLNFGVENEKDKVFNEKGTEEDLDAVAFWQKLNTRMGQIHPDIMMIAEESTAWPMVTYPPSDGGLGFHYKWDMGWMHDTLHYMQSDFPYRPSNHNLLTFSMMYNFNENFILALSHDEVVHGKCSLIRRMPGDYWRQFAGLRLLALYQMTHPGAKLNFMGNELGEFIEWRYYEELEWFLPRDYETHRKHQNYIRELNHFFRKEKTLWAKNYTWEGFQWLDADNKDQGILSYRRKDGGQETIVVLNFQPNDYQQFRIGVPKAGYYKAVFESDAAEFGGNGIHNDVVKSEKIPWQGEAQSVEIKLPPLAGLVLKKTTKPREAK